MSKGSTTQEPRTLSDFIRQRTSGVMSHIGHAAYRLGFHPDLVTAFGLLLVLLASFVIAQGKLQIAALILMIALPFDALDGAIARAMQRSSSFGAMFDSTLDRYADGFIFLALSYYFAVNHRFEMLVISQIALLGSLLVSYTRARAEGLGVDCKVGWFTRMERLAIILLVLLFPVLLDYGIGVLALGTNLTAMQRLWHVYQTLKKEGE